MAASRSPEEEQMRALTPRLFLLRTLVHILARAGCARVYLLEVYICVYGANDEDERAEDEESDDGPRVQL